MPQSSNRLLPDGAWLLFEYDINPLDAMRRSATFFRCAVTDLEKKYTGGGLLIRPKPIPGGER